MKKNILIISIYYPPIQSIASNRIYSFAKYLDKEKYNIFVLTLDSQKEYSNDLDGVSVIRVKNDIFFKPFIFTKRTHKLIHYTKVLYNRVINYFFEDSYRGWVKKSLEIIPNIIEKNSIDIMLSSYAPTSPHTVALQTKKRFPHLRWIVDMRDEMSQNPFINRRMKKKYIQLESEIFNYADALTTVSKPILDEFKMLSNEKELLFREIRNGYDFEIKDSNYRNEVFTIAYVGNFYGDRNPNIFLQALNSLVDKRKRKIVKVKFVGVKTHFYLPSSLVNAVDVIPSVEHGKAIEIMRQSDALLLIHPTNGRKGVFTGKLFEYLAVMKPIIALIDEDDVAAQLIKEVNAGVISDNEDIEKIESIFKEVYDEWEERRERVFNKDIIFKHHRKEQVKRLEKLIKELTCE
ncbi:MAG: hypothetical protein FAF03_04955 [Epsilonproteobacteria bacterium]|nr:hypothetical protein [Campylobacterota bacterium]